MNKFSEDELRNEIQHNFRETEIKYNQLNKQISNYERYLNYYNEHIKYDFLALLKSIIISILTAFAYIWLIGLVIEAVNLSIDIANNVRVIRELKESDKGEK